MATKPGEIYLGQVGTELLLYDGGRSVTPQRNEITKSNRTISGKLIEDVIRTYYTWQIDYELLPAEDFENLQDLYDIGEHLNLIVVDRNNVSNNYTVKIHPVNGKRNLWSGGWYYEAVSMLLEEV